MTKKQKDVDDKIIPCYSINRFSAKPNVKQHNTVGNSYKKKRREHYEEEIICFLE